MRYNLRTSLNADREIDQIVAWMSERSRSGARTWYRALQTAFRQIKKDPLRFAIATEDGAFPETVRETTFRTRHGNPYRILYTIVDNEFASFTFADPGRIWSPADLPFRNYGRSRFHRGVSSYAAGRVGNPSRVANAVQMRVGAQVDRAFDEGRGGK